LLDHEDDGNNMDNNFDLESILRDDYVHDDAEEEMVCYVHQINNI
jgi:hypothetical protein